MFQVAIGYNCDSHERHQTARRGKSEFSNFQQQVVRTVYGGFLNV
jgi:hypothetical protein